MVRDIVIAGMHMTLVGVAAQAARQWEDEATSVDRVELLRKQPRGVELEFRVLAMNRSGKGSPSATVTAVL